MKKVLLGIDVLREKKMALLKGKRIGLLCNHASVDNDYANTKDIIHALFGNKLKAIFAPQHGFYGVEQDNMKESSHSVDERLKIPIFSLYHKERAPADYMLDEIDALLIDLFDVGTRVYTFIYTMALCMQKAAKLGKQVIVLDRPNPISGRVEGNLVKDGFASFVGMHPIPMRHGLTIGELATLFNNKFGIGCDLRVIKMSGYKKSFYYDETMLPFPFPSPNMPTLNSAIVYPGQVILEGTNISEGRGTTRPFEICGAPFINPRQLIDSLKQHDTKGAQFKEIYFKPTFNKHKDEVCGGLLLRVTNKEEYAPYLTAIILLKEIINLYPEQFKFAPPPYEYEFERLPFDIITGSNEIRENLFATDGLERIKNLFKKDEEIFANETKEYSFY